jgi:hypothetical protein
LGAAQHLDLIRVAQHPTFPQQSEAEAGCCHAEQADAPQLPQPFLTALLP